MEIRTLRTSELDAAWELDADSFHIGPEKREHWMRFVDPERVLGAFEGERLVGVAEVLPFGQFFGGCAVAMGGLSGVSVAPDWRGSGLAKRLCTACLETMRERGEVISSLYPGTTSLYRGLGWELAGSVAVRKIAPRSLLALPRTERGRTRPMTSADVDSVRACYWRLAQPTNGCLDRAGPLWERLEAAWEDRSGFVFEGEAGRVAGYVVYHQIDGEYSHLGGEFGIVLDEMVATTRDAAVALWRLLGSWGSQADQVVFRGAVEEPALLLLPEQESSTLADFRWMTRVVDAVGAVASRGFPHGLKIEVPLSLSDPILGANQGDYVLSVQKGRGELARTGVGSGPVFGIGAFSSLYTGWATTARLGAAGLLAGGTSEQRAALDAAFGGPTPWMLDEF
jgi:predicted acetyltransferase